MSVSENALYGKLKHADGDKIKRALVRVAKKYNLRIEGVNVLGKKTPCMECMYVDNCSEINCRYY